MRHWRECIEGDALAAHRLWLGDGWKGDGRLVVIDADLRNAEVPGRVYDGARLVRSDLRGVDLTDADLSQVELSHCDQTGA